MTDCIIFYINLNFLGGFDAYKKCQLRYLITLKNIMQYLKDYR